jgi:hypothetical protein
MIRITRLSDADFLIEPIQIGAHLEGRILKHAELPEGIKYAMSVCTLLGCGTTVDGTGIKLSCTQWELDEGCLHHSSD